MQLSYHADYSCRVLIYLALNGGEKASIEEIAQAFRVSDNHLVKVVHQLGKLGFVETSRGRGGGVRLARAAREISLGAVIRAMEPGFDIVECHNQTTNTCPIVAGCGLNGILGEAREAFLQTLDRYTVADAIRDQKLVMRALRLKPVASAAGER